MGVGSWCLPWRTWGLNSVIRFGSKCLYLLNHLARHQLVSEHFFFFLSVYPVVGTAPFTFRISPPYCNPTRRGPCRELMHREAFVAPQISLENDSPCVWCRSRAELLNCRLLPLCITSDLDFGPLVVIFQRVVLWSFWCCLEIGSHCLARAVLELTL